MLKARLHFDGDNVGIEKLAREYSLTQDVENKLNSIPEVIDNVTTDSGTDALSARMGMRLQEQIDNLASRGRYLTTWNAETGLPDTNPQVSPYVYRAGDYYIVGNVSSGTNYRPHGSSYTSGVASQTVEPESLSVNDLYIYDGTQWVLQGGGGTHSTVWGSISGTLSDQVDLQNALDGKLNIGDNLVFNDTTTVLVGRGVHSPGGDSSGHWVTIDPKGEVFTHNVTTGGYNETTLGNGEIEILHSVSSTSTDYTVTIDHEKLTANDGINTQIYSFLGSNRIATLNDITAHTIPELHTNDVYYDLISTTPGTYKLVDSGKYLGYTHMIPSGVGYVTKPAGGDFTTGGNGILYFKGELDWTYIEGGTIIRSDMRFSQGGTGSDGYEFLRLAPMAGFSAPIGPYRGQLWYDISADKLKVYDDSNNWVLVDTDEVVVSTTAPSNPTLGLLWYDSTNNVLKSYDGTNWNACGGGSTYSAGNGISIDANNEISVDTTVVATQNDIANFFDKTSDDADDIDDTNSTNKFVTATEKSTWDGKQDAIQDLSTIRSNAQAGKNASDEIATYGDVVTHDANEFATASQGGKADTAIQPGDNVSELTNDAGYITDAYHDSTKQDKLIAGANIQIAADGKTISATDTTYVAGDFDIKDLADSTGKRASWDAKQDAISDLATIRSGASAGATAIQPNDNISELTNDAGYITDAYHDSTKQDVISDLATIRSGAALGATALQSGDNVSELTNDAGYITNAVNDLANYYKKTETYTQAEINSLISNFGGFEVVSTLPVSDIKTNIIYLLGPTGTGADKYEEYIYYNSTWTKIGDTSVDLTNYFNTSTQTSDAITQGSTNLFLTSAERTKLNNTSGVNSGDETKSSIQTALGAATSSNSGYLTSTDWATFNGKANASDINTKMFKHIGSNGFSNAEIQEAVDYIITSGKLPILVRDVPNVEYIAYSPTEWVRSGNDRYIKWESAGTNSYEDGCHYLTKNIIQANLNSSNQVTSVNHSSETIGEYLDTDYNYSTPYTPLYDGSPATKKYVDDSIVTYTAGTGINIDANNNISNALPGAIIASTAPSNPTEGQLWYDTTNDVLKSYDGTNWNECGGGAVTLEAGTGISITATSAHKDNQGPCPDGFHIPTSSEWGRVIALGITESAWGSSNNSSNVSNYLKLPLTGRIKNTGGVDPDTYYWSCQVNGTDYGYNLDITSPTASASDRSYKANAFPIRAFADTPVIPDSSWTTIVSGTGTDDGIFWNQSLGLITITDGTDAITIMDKNLGATTVWSYGETVTADKAGKLYQWGNNHGFDWNTTPSATSSSRVSASMYGPGNYYDNSTFIIYAGSWDSSNNYNLWGGVTLGTWGESGYRITALNNGDVVGPSSATDGHLAVFDGATGKIIKDGGILNDVKVSSTAPSSPTEGMVWYDTTNDQLKVYDGANWNVTGKEYNAGTGIEIKNGPDYSAMQGPAPDGFHVPLNTEWQALCGILTSTFGLASNTTTLRTYLKMPSAGYRYGTTSSPKDVGNLGCYWAANDGRYLRIVSDMLNPNYNEVKNCAGRNIRPFKDVSIIPDNTWTTLYDGSSIATGAGVFHNITKGLISVSGDGQTWYTIADKNLGATTVYNNGDVLSESNCGGYFQKGNNYMFPFTGDVTTSSTQVDASSYGPDNYYSSSTFITGTGRWDSSNNNNLWGGVTGVVTLENAITNTGVLSVNGQTGDVTIQTGGTYTAGNGINIDANDVISVDSTYMSGYIPRSNGIYPDNLADSVLYYGEYLNGGVTTALGLASDQIGVRANIDQQNRNRAYLEYYNGAVDLYLSDTVSGTNTTAMYKSTGIESTAGGTTETFEFQGTGNDKIARLKDVPSYTAGNGISIDANDEISVDNTIARVTDVNTKTFYLSSASDLTTAQAAYDWYLAGKNPIIIYDDNAYILGGENTSSQTIELIFKKATNDYSDYQNGTTAIRNLNLKLIVTSGSVSQIKNQASNICYILRTGYDYNIPYTPQYDGSPATKKYVDDNVVQKSATAPSSPTEGMVWYDTTNDVLKVYDGTNWNEVGGGSGDMLYADFNWASKTGATVTLDLNSTITPSANFTVNAPATIKDGQMYVLRVTQGATAYTMTLGTNVTNPYGESLTMSAYTVNQFSFLAVGGNLELQPSVTVGESGAKIFYAKTGDTGHEISDIGEELETWLNATGQTDDYDTFKDAVLVYDGVTYNRRNTFYTDSGYKYIYFISRSPNVQNNNNGTSKGYYSLIRFKFSYNSGWFYEHDYSTSYITTTTQSFLRTDFDYSTPYTPLYNGSPATKAYVDTRISSIPTYTSGNGINIDPDTNKISANVYPAQQPGTAGTIKIWLGSQTDYDNLSSYDSGTLYFTTSS